ncbi:MAG: T9SS type A sorting domain-containing protein [bacterium]|nr:T9SS type A sorting domain-containing protein [bacterium]
MIRRVPEEYASILTAISAANPEDTVLLAPNDYQTGVVIPIHVTIASRWIFSSDSNDILNTTWRVENNRIRADHCRITFSGLRFLPPTTPYFTAGVFTGIGSEVHLNHCLVEGEFGSTNNFFGGLFLDANTFYASDCQFIFADTSGHLPLLRSDSCTTTFERCYMSGRTTSGIALVAVGDGLLTINNCVASVFGEVFFFGGEFSINRSNFKHFGTRGLFVGYNGTGGTQLIRDVTFDSCQATTNYGIIRVTQNTDTVIIAQSIFRYCFNAQTSIIEANSTLKLDRCLFSDNILTCIAANDILIDSCRFIANRGSVFQRFSASSLEHVFITNSDFIGNSIQFTTRPDHVPEFSSIIAPNCYWGDPTGPNHPLNPGGLGQTLPAFVNPFPFRTTPVFPDVAAPDPITQNGVILPQPFQFSLYPNPTNGSTTIRFSLPPTSPVTGVLFDRTGRQVSTFSLDDANRRNGIYPLSLVNTPSGIYFVRLSTVNTSTTQSLLLVK